MDLWATQVYENQGTPSPFRQAQDRPNRLPEGEGTVSPWAIFAGMTGWLRANHLNQNIFCAALTLCFGRAMGSARYYPATLAEVTGGADTLQVVVCGELSWP